MARAERLAIFVEGALPGERVVARVLRRRARYVEATAVEILRRSPDRVEPPCEHYGTCGGCQLQHLGIAAQRAARRGQVTSVLRRIGGFADPPVADALRAGEPWGYRFRVDFDVRAGSDRRPVLGLHRRGRSDEIVEIRRCLLISDAAREVVGQTMAAARDAGITGWDGARGRGLLRGVSIQEAGSTREILVALETGRGEDAALGALARRLVRRAPRVVGVVRRVFDRKGEPAGAEILTGRGEIEEVVDGDRFRIPADGFFQPNRLGCTVLRRAAVQALAPGAGERILELYAGVGFHSVPLGRRARALTIVEGSRTAADAARTNLARAGLANVRVICGEVSRVIGGLLHEPGWDAALVDPPRVGLASATARALAGSAIARLVYVSCDPATLARDLRLLAAEGGYRLESVVPVDLFPQTRHVECVAALRRGAV